MKKEVIKMWKDFLIWEKIFLIGLIGFLIFGFFLFAYIGYVNDLNIWETWKLLLKFQGGFYLR